MAVSLVVLSIDAWTKAAVAGSYELETAPREGFVSIVHAQNPGVNHVLNVLGVIPGGIELPIAVFVAIGIVASVAVFSWAGRERHAWIPAGLAFGAVLGNVLDLVGHGYVTDFIYIQTLGASANVADLAIVAVVVWMLVSGRGRFLRRRLEPSSPAAEAPGA